MEVMSTGNLNANESRIDEWMDVCVVVGDRWQTWCAKCEKMESRGGAKSEKEERQKR